MKTADIAVGTVYTNGKGRFRLVTAAGPDYKLYSNQENFDCIQFAAVNSTKKGLKFAKGSYAKDGSMLYSAGGNYHNSTRESFARWAEREATVEEADEIRAVLGDRVEVTP